MNFETQQGYLVKNPIFNYQYIKFMEVDNFENICKDESKNIHMTCSSIFKKFVIPP